MRQTNPDFQYNVSAFKSTSAGRKGGFKSAELTNLTKGLNKVKVASKSLKNINRADNTREGNSNYTLADYFRDHHRSLQTSALEPQEIKRKRELVILKRASQTPLTFFSYLEKPERTIRMGYRFTYSVRHSNQNKYIAPQWQEIAASATSTIFIPLHSIRQQT